ncbi:phospholipase D/nuclease [Sodiomyces alkalinus F11]|uniref:Phospholipase D/nuclease n=1 Tax=Sodiomyces alkalinus (strain CBS 110278 / VKM F-3762 / F11) TaxID=1314773 RepID=A0A3N2Q1I6_SODAK|nr:phospholipase D/nuclease [Sodiomyces alkalinus F11]ROT40548.1 phospholipase D/nuclease [Sodiomyces alkalinus F11]
MSHFDEDTRHLVKVHVVHGFWKREDSNRIYLEEAAKQYKNVRMHIANMPEMFGTHHSKMMILFRHDDTAQVIIHTANMIPKDWTNMTNAVWKSPLLPKLSQSPDQAPRESLRNDKDAEGAAHSSEAGERFKLDLLAYLHAYDARRVGLGPLTDELAKYDFSSVRAALIASVPGRHNIQDSSRTAWGWPALGRVLKDVPVQEGRSEVVVQISSIATLGAKDHWLQNCLFDSLASSKNQRTARKPTFRVVFPTADEVRRSLDGYASGASIHTKVKSAQQAKQLEYLRPIFCHWANDTLGGKSLPKDAVVRDAGRQRAAPHIKTYIRYGEETIDWALLTSANISKQAWGEAANASREVRIASWEVGVLVWPSLLAGDEQAKMVGTFKTDMPTDDVTPPTNGKPVVGLRIPYNLPLQPYNRDEEPWVAEKSYSEPDWKGLAWNIEQ